MLKAVEAANETQKRVLVDKLKARFPQGLQGLSVALWGLAFKPNTDDMREAPSRIVVESLLAEGARVCAYDPVAMDEARRIFGSRDGLSFAEGPMQALEQADVLMIVTEWKEFRSPDFEAIRQALRHPVVIDGRNMYAPPLVRASGLEYYAIGRTGAV